MKITSQAPKFEPVVIVLETKAECAALAAVVGPSSPSAVEKYASSKYADLGSTSVAEIVAAAADGHGALYGALRNAAA